MLFILCIWFLGKKKKHFTTPRLADRHNLQMYLGDARESVRRSNSSMLPTEVFDLETFDRRFFELVHPLTGKWVKAETKTFYLPHEIIKSSSH